jgi:ribonuclease P protein component
MRPRFGLPRSARLIRRNDFRRVYGKGQRAHGSWMVVVALRRQEPGHRLGIAVSKEHGRAVRRNKIKRLLREAFRLERPELEGQFDLILIPRAREGRFELDGLRRELRELLARLAAGARSPKQREGRRRRRR